MLVKIGKIFEFEAAHQLPNHEGKCKDLHGHSYRLEVEVCGPKDTQEGSSSEGMVMDFAYLKDIVQQNVICLCDHQFLNEVFPFRTTAENLAAWMFNKIGAALKVKTGGACYLVSLGLWETSNSFAHVTGGPNELYSN